MDRVFLSYAREDRRAVEAIYNSLVTAGFQPWMDTRDLLPGELWEAAITRAIQECEFFVACVSTKSRNKRGFLQKELRLGLDIWQQKLVSDIFLIPVRLEECGPDERLASFQWLDWFEPNGWELLVRALSVGRERTGQAINSDKSRRKRKRRSTKKDGLEHESISVITTHGYIDHISGEELLEKFRRLLKSRVRLFVVDCADTKIVNSLGISALIEVLEAVLDQNAVMAFCNLTPVLIKTFQIMGIANYALIASSLGEAVAALEPSLRGRSARQAFRPTSTERVSTEQASAAQDATGQESTDWPIGVAGV